MTIMTQMSTRPSNRHIALNPDFIGAERNS